MPLWDAIKKHLTDQAGKYIAIGVFLVVGIVAWQSWDRAKAGFINFLKDALLDTDPYHEPDKSDSDPALALAISNFQQGVLGFVKDTLLEKDPDKLPDGNKRNADLARAISEFQKSVVRFVGNGAFVGYVEAGTFVLSSTEQTVLPSKKPGTKAHSFQIFAGNNSHVYLEFEISNFDDANYDIQLTFGEQPVCSKHKWTTGFNVVEFKVTDVSSREWSFLGECKEPTSPSEAKLTSPRIKSTQGHKSQLIPIGLKMIRSGIEKEPRVASLEEAIRPTRGTVRQPPADTNATVGYIAVVSPLIEDVFN